MSSELSYRVVVATALLALGTTFALPPTSHAQSSGAQTGQTAGESATATKFEQVKLTEANVKGFIAMQSKLAAIAGEIEGQDEKPDAKFKARLDELAKQSGFESFEDFDRVAASITLVIAGIDPDTGTYRDPKIGIAEDQKDVSADKTLDEKERGELLADLKEALATTPDVAYPSNIELVKKYVADIEKVMQ